MQTRRSPWVSSLTLPILAAFTTVPYLASPLEPTARSKPPAAAYKVGAQTPDAVLVPAPSAVRIEGWLGARILANATNRLLTIDTEPLLAGFKKKPGTHPWIGEHIGKWMHAATLAWSYTGDERLRAKLDAAATDLIASQEPDGYLGTYVPEKRFGLFQGADWDVWSHKYNLMGLLTYYEFTGNQAALDCCRKVGDLLIQTFGPGRKSILAAGTHVGMASTSVLEPMVLLYRHTTDSRYLDFCKYIVNSWTETNGPNIVKALLTTRQVNKTANAKAYEMLSNLVGLCEFVRATGDAALLDPVLIAWEDITSKRLYLTGTASQGEHFRDDHHLPNDTSAHVGETCVTTTWIQLNLQLLRLTGDAKFAQELEKTFYNHLSAAQHPRGDDWCYFTALSGKKPYTSGINCCHSSGPRGMALAPLTAYLQGTEAGGPAILINTFETSSASLQVGTYTVQVRQKSQFPRRGQSEISFAPSGKARFAVRIRVPSWASEIDARLNGKRLRLEPRSGWLAIVARTWLASDQLSLNFPITPKLLPGTHSNEGFAAITYGPFVLAYDTQKNPNLPGVNLVRFPEKPALELGFGLQETPRVLATVISPRLKGKKSAAFLPFADAGASSGTYKVWLPSGAEGMRTDDGSLLASGQESRSRLGNVEGSINDADPATFVVTFDGRKTDEDWFAVALDQPTAISRVVMAIGNIFHDGGWFDASQSKPRVQIKQTPSSQWEDLGPFPDYPPATSTDPGTLKDPSKRKFELRLEQPRTVVAVRVIGKPASGDNPQQAFSSCAELQAFQ